MDFEVKHHKTGEVLFIADIRAVYPDTSPYKLRASVEWATKSGVDLRGADLRGAFLQGLTLHGVDLSCADLSGSDLSYADLSYTNLIGTKLTNVNFTATNLAYADLRRVDLTGSGLAVIYTGDWPCYIQKGFIQIGCFFIKAEELFSAPDDRVQKWANGALEWWHTWRPVIVAIHATLVKEGVKNVN